MKKGLKVFLSLLVLMMVLVSAIACAKTDDKTPDQGNQKQPEQNTLSTPVISISETGKVTWQPIEHATRYEIFINDNKVAVTVKTEFQITYEELGAYKVAIKAIDMSKKYKDSELSKAVTYTILKQKLAIPDVKKAGEEIYWAAVDNATGYKIYVDGTELENANVYEKDGSYRFVLSNVAVGQHEVKVSAIGDAEKYIESDLSRGMIIQISAPDTATSWDCYAMGEKWGETPDNAQGFYRYIGAGQEPYIMENYITIPSGMTYFKMAFMRFSDDSANPTLTVYVKADGEADYKVVRAIGQDKDYVVTPDWNRSFLFVYDFSEYSGKNAKVRIAIGSEDTTKGAVVSIQTIGFSDYATEAEHVSTKSAWSKSEIGLDWRFENACGYVWDGTNGYFSNNAGGYLENKVTIPEGMKSLKIKASAQTEVTINGVAVTCMANGSEYVYDLSAYEGQTVTIRISATALTAYDSIGLCETEVLLPPVIQVTNNEVTWAPVSGATGYLVYVNGVVTGDAQTETAYTVTGEAGEYRITVKAVDATRASNMSNEVVVNIIAPDTATSWDCYAMGEKWGETPDNAQGFYRYIGAGQEPYIMENYITIPSGMTYFKMAFMRFSDDSANPTLTVYVKADGEADYKVVRAIGQDKDYVVTPDWNRSFLFVYDFSEYSGKNAKVRIAIGSEDTTKGAVVSIQTIGFSDYATEAEHVSTKSAWSKSEIGLDWRFENACGYVWDGTNGYFSNNAGGYLENKVTIPEGMKSLKIKASAQTEVTINGVAVTCMANGSEYVYDLSAYEGQTVTIRISATALTAYDSIGLC